MAAAPLTASSPSVTSPAALSAASSVTPSSASSVALPAVPLATPSAAHMPSVALSTYISGYVIHCATAAPSTICHWLRLLLHRWSCHQRHHRRAISGTVCCTSHAPPLSTIQHLRLRQWLQAIGGTSIMRRLQHHQQHYTPSVALFTYISGTISARFDVCTRSHTWLDNLRWQPYRQFYIDARHRWALYPVTGLNHCYSSYIIRPTVRQLYHHLPTAMSPATLPIISLAALLAMLQRPQLHHRSRRHSCPQPSVTCAV